MTISLRSLPPDVEKSILDLSRREGLSLNKATLRLLERSVRKPAENTDFEEFSGTWSGSEADEFDLALSRLRQIDPMDWDLEK